MKKISTFLYATVFLVSFFLPSTAFSQILFTEDFESGTAGSQWGTFYVGEDSVHARPMAEAPSALAEGGSYVGWLQDIDASYTGSAVAIHGPADLTNYSIEADVYCYVNKSTSAYTGLVVYADTAKRDFYKLRVDFDANDRINFSGLKSDPNTFQPLYNKNFTGTENPGLFPTEDGWHKMKIEVRATSSNETSFWCYFDGTLLAGCPITDTTSTRVTSGGFGLYAFQQGTGIAGYFDNIVVEQLTGPVVSVDENPYPVVPTELYLAQNYPNPFNPETRISFKLPADGFISLIIYDLLGRKVKTLISEYKPSGSYFVSWNGKDESGSNLSSGIYLYTLKAGALVESKKMMFLK